MKKLIRKIVAGVAAFAVALGILLPVTAGAGEISSAPISVAAEESVATVTPEQLSDENFSILQGLGTSKNLEILRVGINLKNPALETWLLDDKTNTAAALFTVYRYNGTAKASTAKFQVLLLGYNLPFTNTLNKFTTAPMVSVYTRKIGFDDAIKYEDGFFDIMGSQDPVIRLEDFGTDEEYLFDEKLEFELSDGPKAIFERTATYGGMYQDDTFYGNMEGLFPYDRSGTNPQFSFFFNVGSYYSEYFVEFEYGFNSANEESITGKLTSSVRSINGILTVMEERGALEKEFDKAEYLEKAQAVLAAGVTQEVTVEYLEEIEGTYLAQKKTATVSVPIYGGALASDDVAQALGKDSMRVHNSNVKAFVFDEDEKVWHAEYFKSVWLQTKTVDGHAWNMFLDINQSYADYYADLKETVSCGADLYEYMFNQLGTLYPIIETLGLSEDDVHGYFGQVWLPDNNEFASFNAAMAELFNVKTEEFGFINSFKMTEAITYDEHNELMDQYGYTWLKATWEKFVDLVTLQKTSAQYYFFTAKPMEYTAISQTGNTDPDDDDGAGKEVIDDAADDVGDWFDDLLSGGNSLKRLSSVVVVAACAVGVIWGIGKLKGDKKRKK